MAKDREIPEKVILTMTRRIWRMPPEQRPGRLARAKAYLSHGESLNERAVIRVIESLA